MNSENSKQGIEYKDPGHRQNQAPTLRFSQIGDFPENI
jgi:hypothetical protein